MKKKLTALFAGIAVFLSSPVMTAAVTGEQRVSLDPSRTEIVDVSEKPEKSEESVVTVEVYQDIEISTLEDLIELSENCRLDTWSIDKRIILKEDISVYGTEFTSIRTFGGYFEGMGHTIRGINGGTKKSFVGLFNDTQPTAVIVNLNVEGVIKPEGNPMVVGGIVGDNYGIIENCSFAGTVKGKDYVGGIAGFNEAGASIIGCHAYGKITGVHYTGGICGENAGGIAGCINSSHVNTNVDDSKPSITDVNLDNTRESFLSILKGNENQKSESNTLVSGTTDSGGIAGLSLGAITSCINEGTIGYEHVGYNTGGIAGRTSGYVTECINKGEILGRKDVGGIVGQAEPYVQLDLTEDIISQISTNITSLHDMIDTTLTDAGNTSDIITMRLNVVKSFADKALDDTHFLATSATNFVNGTVSSANEALNRIDYIMRELDKEGGVFDQLTRSASDTKKTIKQLVQAVKDIDIEKYMTKSDLERYRYAKEQLEKAPEDYDKAKAAAEQPYNCMFLDQEIHRDDTSFKKALSSADPPIAYPTEALSNIYPYDANGNKLPWPGTDSVANYENIAGIAHFDGDTKKSDFPTDADRDTAWYPYLDTAIEEDKTEYNLKTITLETGEGEITRKTNEQYMKNYGGNTRKEHGDGASYKEQMITYTETVTSLIRQYLDNLTEQERKDFETAGGYADSMVNGLEAAGKGAKSIVSELNSKSKISLPSLGDEFQVRTNSLNSNMQGISDNLGFLNQEMGGSADTLINDLSDVNDQFNKLMLLITDAIDGALEMDYTTTYEDNSDDVALTSIDGTVADSSNYARVKGDLDAGGIAGTMAIEYEFDLESDITGIKDAKMNATYLTKCVLRNNANDGYVQSEKSYNGGIVGLQEMGTVLLCENYGKNISLSGDYVGGIVGQSLSTIKNCSASSIVSGENYVGGIAGKGYEIYDCFAIPNIEEAEDFFGAVAGGLEENGELRGNYFYSDRNKLAGVDGASYSGKAEPQDYESLLAREGVPGRFRTFTVSFILEDKEVGSVSVQKGANLPETDFPVPVLDEGYYVEWDVNELFNITENEEVKAEKHRFLTTIAGERLREDGQSVVLADGKFKDGQKLSVESLVSIGQPVENVTEHFVVEIPKDGELNHKLRFQPGSDRKTDIHVKVGSEWRKMKTEEFGGYLLFDTSGNTVEFLVSEERGINRYYIIAAAAGGAIVLLILILIIAKARKRKKRAARSAGN